MSFTYNETYQLMRKFHDLGRNETLIMDYLFKQSVAEVTYSQLAKAIGQKDMIKNYSAWFNMPRNNPYCYCICDRHDYTGDVACDMECDGDSRCFDQAFTKLNKYIQEYFTDLCKQYEEQGYEFFYPEDDTEFIELCEANEWEFYEDGTFYY